MLVSLHSFVGVLILQFVILKATCKDESNCALQQPPFRRMEPKRGEYYNPNYGYEPYWFGGDWVFAGNEKNKIDICLKHCSELYLHYGVVCGRNLTLAYKTFNTYCDLLREDCTGRSTQFVVLRLNYCFQIKTEADFYKSVQEQLKKNYGIYNPTYGYEPYWTDGSWVFEDEDPDGSTTSMPQVCGEECNYLYREIAEVCGRFTDNFEYYGCRNIFGCYGNRIDDLTEGFQTFETYCKFLDVQCRTPFNSRLILIHRGPCVEDQEKILKPISALDQPVSRVKYYFTLLNEVFQNHSLAPLELE